MAAPEEERRGEYAVRRHVRNSAFAEAEKVISALQSDLGVQEARSQLCPGLTWSWSG
ncbi:hypothetical protein ACWGI9_41085 [Streptomyces sp. NPDC054833]